MNTISSMCLVAALAPFAICVLFCLTWRPSSPGPAEKYYANNGGPSLDELNRQAQNTVKEVRLAPVVSLVVVAVIVLCLFILLPQLMG